MTRRVLVSDPKLSKIISEEFYSGRLLAATVASRCVTHGNVCLSRVRSVLPFIEQVLTFLLPRFSLQVRFGVSLMGIKFQIGPECACL